MVQILLLTAYETNAVSAGHNRFQASSASHRSILPNTYFRPRTEVGCGQADVVLDVPYDEELRIRMEAQSSLPRGLNHVWRRRGHRIASVRRDTGVCGQGCQQTQAGRVCQRQVD